MPCVSGMFFDSDPPWPITQLKCLLAEKRSLRTFPCVRLHSQCSQPGAALSVARGLSLWEARTVL